MARQFLTPVGLPSGNTLPSAGSAGNLFFKADENKVYVHTGSAWIVQQGPTGPTGDTGATGATGPGVAAGGTAGQVLSKVDGTDYNTVWADPKAASTYYLVRNNTGSTIPKGTLVSAIGAEPSGRIDVEPFAAVGGENSELRVMGMAIASIATGVNGEVMSFGTLTGLDTRGDTASALAVGDETWAAGDILFAHPTVAGKLTKVRPQHDLAVAFITVRHASAGQIAIRIVPGNNHLEWMHDVALDSPADNELLAYDSATSLWKNQTAAEAGLAGTDSPTFTGLATFNDITLTDDASIIGTVTVRDDLVLTGETQTLATITDIDQVPVEVNFTKGEGSWETTGFFSATVEEGDLYVFLISSSMLSVMGVGAEIAVDGETATVTSVSNFGSGVYYFDVSPSLTSSPDVLAIDVAATEVQVTVDSTSLDDDVAAIGTSHIAVGPDNLLVSSTEILPTEVRWVGETSAVIGDLVTMRTTDLSKLTGVRYDGVESSITYSATNGSWVVPGVPVKENNDALRIGANAAPSMATLYNSGNTIIGYQTATPLVGGTNNVVIGSYAGSLGESASRNVAIGRASQENSNAMNSTSVGIESLKDATAFTAIAIGDSAGNESNGNDNYFFGYQAGKGLNGNTNTVIGYSGAQYATGDNNIFFGPYAGQYSNGSENLFIGYQAGDSSTESNSLAISGRGSDGYPNPIITGSFNDLSVNFPGSVKLNQATRENVYTTSTGFSGYTFSLVEGTTVRGPIQYITANATSNGTVNIQHSSSLSLNDWLGVGEAVTVVLQVTNGSTAYYPNAWQIDGTSVTPKWQGGTAPSAGNANSIDIYSLTIQKTASATYTILASQTKFA